MPCYYHETPEEKGSTKRERNNKLKNELDKVTRLLCWTMKHIEEFQDSEVTKVLPFNKELEDWHLDHKNRDARREGEKIQKIKENAKKKLTKEELKALGIE